jgi:hypothetical protein
VTTDPVETGREAWARIQGRERKAWDDWLCVARALQIGRSVCMQAAGTNRAVGTRYNRAMVAWLRGHGLDGVSNQERYRLLLILENLPAISAWRDGLDDAKRRRLNHPNGVWFAWHRAIGQAPARMPVINLTRPRRHRAIDKPRWPQSVIREAARGIRETHGNDLIVIALGALNAAFPTIDALIALIEDQRRPAMLQIKGARHEAAIEVHALIA